MFVSHTPWEGAGHAYGTGLRKVQEEPTKEMIVWLDTWTLKQREVHEVTAPMAHRH